MSPEQLSDDQREELLSAARTTVGDELRSLTYFTEATVDQLYLRDDLDQDADIAGFAETERVGFRSKQTYEGTELGGYEFTIRVFENGYLSRIIVGDRGVWVTTEGMPIGRFEELGSALAAVVEGF
jgi:hypothetical protein